MIRRLIKYLLLALVAIALLGGAYVWLFSPFGEVAAALARYKSALQSGDAGEIVRLTADPALDFIDTQRQRALHAGRDEVAALGFRERLMIFGLRAMVHHGTTTAAEMQAASRDQFYAMAEGNRLRGTDSLDKMTLVAVIPMGPGHARGYLDLTGLPPAGIETVLIPLFNGLRFDFDAEGGEWKVDPTPLLQKSADENEYWARQMDPTGNQFIFNMLGVPVTEQEKYWQPLLPQT